MTPQLIPLSKVRIDGGTQPRTEIDYELVSDYAKNINSLPPVTVHYDGATYWLSDGFHRYFAHKNRNCESIWAEVLTGSKRDAILYSVGANANHGKRRTNEDKRKAILTLLNDEEWSQWSDTKIADQCQVDRSTVGVYRRELSIMGKSHDRPTRKVQRGTQVYEQKVKEKPEPKPVVQPEPKPTSYTAPLDEQGPVEDPQELQDTTGDLFEQEEIPVIQKPKHDTKPTEFLIKSVRPIINALSEEDRAQAIKGLIKWLEILVDNK